MTRPSLTRTLHLMHYSQNHADTDAQVNSDLEWALSQKPDMISFTELQGHQQNLRQIAAAHNYHAVAFGQEGIAVNRDTCVLKDQGKSRGTDRIAPDGGAGRQSRYVNYVRVIWHGESVWYHVSHWVNMFSTVSPGRKDAHDQMGHMLVQQVQRHGARGNLSFFAGDTNDDDGATETKGPGSTNTIFKEGRLVTIWDEVKNWPGTMSNHGRTIDVIGKYDPDTRVTGTRGLVHHERNSDHRPISAWYDVVRVKEPGDGTPPPANPDPTHGPHYSTGGNVSWNDYRDNTLYNIDEETEHGPDDSAT